MEGIGLNTGDGKGQNILMIVLLGLVIILLVLLVAVAYLLIPAAVKNSKAEENNNTAKEPTVAINITNSGAEEPKKQVSSDTQTKDTQAKDTNISENVESYSELDSSYILPFSSRRNLISADIKNFNLEELVLARNEIFARHGYIFSTPWIRAYFESKSWYKPNQNYDGSLNSTEYYNVDFIKKYENVLKGSSTGSNSGNSGGYILPYSGRRRLTGNDIGGLSLDWLVLARNEIYARHGYVFKTPWIRQYFESKSWYVPDPYYGGNLDDIEYYNVMLIKEYEDILKSR